MGFVTCRVKMLFGGPASQIGVPVGVPELPLSLSFPMHLGNSRCWLKYFPATRVGDSSEVLGPQLWCGPAFVVKVIWGDLFL